jgi:hypothetical protein
MLSLQWEDLLIVMIKREEMFSFLEFDVNKLRKAGGIEKR